MLAVVNDIMTALASAIAFDHKRAPFGATKIVDKFSFTFVAPTQP